MNETMKTMMELLISLQRSERSLLLARRGRQLSPLEEQFARRHLDLVREIIPAAVLTLYDEMKKTGSDLLSHSPELFAMSVLVATYRILTPSDRKKFLNHFATQPGAQTSSNDHGDNRSSRPTKRLAKGISGRHVARN